jgi:hypothetical protein
MIILGGGLGRLNLRPGPNAHRGRVVQCGSVAACTAAGVGEIQGLRGRAAAATAWLACRKSVTPCLAVHTAGRMRPRASPPSVAQRAGPPAHLHRIGGPAAARAVRCIALGAAARGGHEAFDALGQQGEGKGAKGRFVIKVAPITSCLAIGWLCPTRNARCQTQRRRV